jgi:hypothetical protein
MPKNQGFVDDVVKDLKPKPKKAVERIQGRGRPSRDPDSLRTERLVVRIHPDLMRWLTKIATENGITRSLLVERTLVSFINLSQGTPVLDHMGREFQDEPPQDSPLGTPQSFSSVWRRAIGGEYKPGGFEQARRAAARHNRENDEND